MLWMAGWILSPFSTYPCHLNQQPHMPILLHGRLFMNLKWQTYHYQMPKFTFRLILVTSSLMQIGNQPFGLSWMLKGIRRLLQWLSNLLSKQKCADWDSKSRFRSIQRSSLNSSQQRMNSSNLSRNSRNKTAFLTPYQLWTKYWILLKRLRFVKWRFSRAVRRVRKRL
ncbi:hypothetical protein PAXRUDRAFT_765294 [Paxillus rubicundulus Ve08.2h10]|uniref:Uncharacterized protein n=1 Tax=Paxillus rubicundulus Ve08.2h10 TaxID=930991 RepID=A0A0D0DP50_9AGAM|nr:hypothetical protein PAXRUDRAFT_765294 [Paxillus rubicundulus Ve08.2h10]